MGSSSYSQTTDPRDEVEKIVMDALEERKTGWSRPRREFWCLTNETNGTGKGKGKGGKGEHEGKGGGFGG